jgi:hypothetical protein
MQIRDLFASENPQELELDDDPASYFPSFQVVSPTDEQVVLMLCHLIPQRLVFALLFFSLPSFILFSIYFFYLRRHADDDNLFFRLWKKATSLFRSNSKLNLASGFAVLQKEELQNLCGGVCGGVQGISFVNVCPTKLLSLSYAKLSDFFVDVEASCKLLKQSIWCDEYFAVFFFPFVLSYNQKLQRFRVYGDTLSSFRGKRKALDQILKREGGPTASLLRTVRRVERLLLRKQRLR